MESNILSVRDLVTETSEDSQVELPLRPRSLAEFIGQSRTKKALEVLVVAAKERGEAVEHTLIYGPPGLGKTSLAHILAHEMQVNVRVTSGPALERAGDLAAILTNLQPGDILFIDEIHRLHKVVEETLYPAMEDFCLDLVIGKGPSARTLRLDLPKFTIVGATTRVGLLSSPLRDRFGVIHKLEYYSTEELMEVIMRTAKLLETEIGLAEAVQIARRSRGTPRIANKLLKRVRDIAQVRKSAKISEEVISEALGMLEIDELGLDATDRQLLVTLIKSHNGGPTGLTTLAAMIAEDPQTVEDMIEPYLLQMGLLKKTPRGRMATVKAGEHLGISLDSQVALV